MSNDLVKTAEAYIENLRANKDKTVGRNSIIIHPEFAARFLAALDSVGDNNKGIFLHLRSNGMPISYSQVCYLMGKIFGKHNSVGRPQKYFNDGHRIKKNGKK